MNFKSVDEILEFAIAREQEAVDFYTEISQTMENSQTKRLFLSFAAEEKGHRIKLEGIKTNKSLAPSEQEIRSLNISDYLVDVDVQPGMNYQDALIVAMKKEKAAFRLYNDLMSATTDPALQDIFRMLAQEEAKHKLRFELEYDEYVLTDN